MADGGEVKKRCGKSRKSVANTDFEKFESDFAAVTDLCKTYEFYKALNLLNKVESRTKKNGSDELIERCSLMQAEIYVRMGQHENALRALLKCSCRISSVKLLAQMILTTDATKDNKELVSMATDLLAKCLLNASSDDAAALSQCRLLYLDGLCRLSKVTTVKDYVEYIGDEELKANGQGGRYLHQVLSKVRPLLRATSKIKQAWLKPTNLPASRHPPYVTLFKNNELDPGVEPYAEVISHIASVANYATLDEHVLLLGDCSFYYSLLQFVELLKDMERYDQNVNEPSVRVSLEDTPKAMKDLDVTAGILNTVKMRTKRNYKRRALYDAMNGGETQPSQLEESRTEVKTRCLDTTNLSLNRIGTPTWKTLSSVCMDHKVRQSLSEILKRRSLWSVGEIGLVMFEVLCRNKHLLIGNHEKYTICLCYILYFLWENVNDYNNREIVSSGCLFLHDNVKDSRLLCSFSPMQKRIRKHLKRSGTTILCLILDTMKSTATILHDISSPLSIKDPQEFLRYMFRQLNSILLQECAPNGPPSLKGIILRSRLVFVMAKYILWDKLPKKTAVLSPKYARYLYIVEDITKCLHSLLLLAHSMTLSESSKNIHLRLARSIHDGRFNFHNSLTSGSFALDVKCVERRYLNLYNTLKKFTLKN
ncbi:hypothetical protein BgAZ_301790 [Babesia gibsoni]|uniref:Uncharacterized protein n=1 Tax=Babesia gibsoni TaxID=33632 RepID=A0AAD8LPS1_BABGI|nr:hypothetical protein BgAZ_301790 [Babesia gibsoni]